MSDHAATLKSMLQDIIHNRQEQAEATMHDYFIAKSREVAGLAAPEIEPEDDLPEDEEDEVEDE